MRHGAADVANAFLVRFQACKMGFDTNFGEMSSLGVDTKDSAEQFDVGRCSPSMTVRACAIDIAGLSPSGEPHSYILAPDVEPGQVVVAKTGLDKAFVKIMLEIDRGGGQSCVIYKFLSNRACLFTLSQPTDQRKTVAMLREVVLLDAVGIKSA